MKAEQPWRAEPLSTQVASWKNTWSQAVEGGPASWWALSHTGQPGLARSACHPQLSLCVAQQSRTQRWELQFTSSQAKSTFRWRKPTYPVGYICFWQSDGTWPAGRMRVSMLIHSVVCAFDILERPCCRAGLGKNASAGPAVWVSRQLSSFRSQSQGRLISRRQTCLRILHELNGRWRPQRPAVPSYHRAAR